MKKNYLIVILAIFISFFNGCGGDSTTETTSTSQNDNVEDVEIINMQKNITYLVQKGDKIEKISSNPVIKIESELGSNNTKVTLISGEANIVKK